MTNRETVLVCLIAAIYLGYLSSILTDTESALVIFSAASINALIIYFSSKMILSHVEDVEARISAILPEITQELIDRAIEMKNPTYLLLPIKK